MRVRNAQPPRQSAKTDGGPGGVCDGDGEADNTSHRTPQPARNQHLFQEMNTSRAPDRGSPTCSLCNGPAAPDGTVRGRSRWWCAACEFGWLDGGEVRG